MDHSTASSDERSVDSFDVEENLLPAEKNLRYDGYLSPQSGKHASSRYRLCPSTMGLVAVFSLGLNMLLAVIVLRQSQESKFGSFENGFSTDMEPAKAAMEVVRIPFTGELKRHPNGTMYRDMPGPQYFGEPSEEIEHNWGVLLYASGLDLNEDEITQTGLKDTTWEEPQGGLWRTGLDVFHQLHCLNMIRKSFYPEHYKMIHDSSIDDPPRLRNMHRGKFFFDEIDFCKYHSSDKKDHCLDYIRQALMCNVDSTPVRLKWDYQAHFLIPKFDQLHTCRNFELLHAWSRARALEKTHNESIRLIDEMKKEEVL